MGIRSKAAPKAKSKLTPAQQQKQVEKAIAADRKRLANPIPTAAEQRRMSEKLKTETMDKKMKAAAKRNYKNK